ncbi:gliding motility lipoprotein GldH [Pontibacter qinzhouensis]|uniref:Gliding motility lipoprotein GldH n=1 Tax=Pontibacter qinzhouensis TaxID=2603253 RepID=A0A5C8J205_9BACT|nr:gliding motility lipoprotein GldH [Pontibacter qinzhouensis]TXK28263.1 gliding motility lipoprotein GldH [Pontibacter qinzhouensis]
MHKLGIWVIAIMVCTLISCDPARVYEQNVDLPEGNWYVDNSQHFEFQIQDTTQRYDIYFNVRYALSYEFYNLYLQHQLVGPDSTQLSSALHELKLLDPKTGKPLGKGSSNLFDLQALAVKDVTFRKVGTYRLKLTQYMRRDPLANIMAVGIRVATKN